MKRLLCLLFAAFLLNPFAPARAQSVATAPGAGTYATGLGLIWTGVGVMSTAAVFCSAVSSPRISGWIWAWPARMRK